MKTMKTRDIIILVLLTIVFVTIRFLSEKYLILNWIYILVYFYVLYLVISKKSGIKPRWASLLGSFLLPGLGQVIYAKQWLKMIILLTVLIGGSLFLPIIFLLSPSIALSLLLLMFIIAIYNLIDAYKIGKKAEVYLQQARVGGRV